MNKKPFSIKSSIAIGLIINSLSALAATYNPPDAQSVFDSTDMLGNESNFSATFDDFLQSTSTDSKEQYVEVLNLLKQNKLDEAEKKISALLKQSPEQSDFYSLKAITQTLKKNPTAARQSYQKALDLNPDSFLANFGMAMFFFTKNELSKAKTHIDKALAINNKSIEAYRLSSGIAYRQKKYRDTENILLAGLTEVQGDADKEAKLTEFLGKFYTLQKQPDKVLSIVQELVNRYPDNNTALSLLASAQLINNKKELAEQTLAKLVDQNQQDKRHRLLLVKLLMEQPDKENQIFTLLDEIEGLDPNNLSALFYKTIYLTRLRRFQEALASAEKLDNQYPSALGKILQGDIYLAEKKWDKALELNLQAYKIQPHHTILTKIISLLNKLDRSPEAIEFLNKELDKNPANDVIRFDLANLYTQRKDFQQAEKHYRIVLDSKPDNALVLNNLAWVYVQLNKPEAMELASSAYNKSPESATIADTYGYILMKQGDRKKGLDILKKAADMAPKVSGIQFHLAEAYAENGNKDQAVAILEAILKSGNNFPEKNSAIALLDYLKK